MNIDWYHILFLFWIIIAILIGYVIYLKKDNKRLHRLLDIFYEGNSF